MMRFAVAWFAAALSAGCQSAPEQYSYASLPGLTQTQQAELGNLIAEAVNLPQVQLAANAFKDTHILVLEPAVSSTPRGQLATGRTTTRPQTFHLLSDGRNCLLEHVNSGARYALSFGCNPL